MTIEHPLFMQARDYSARLVRQLVAQQYDEGVLDLVAFKVTQRGAGANFSVDVAAGGAIVQGDDQTDQGNYMVRSTAVENVVLDAAPGSNSRYDIIILQINDSNAGGAAGDNAVVKFVKGTAAASPTVPAVPSSAILLATIGPITSGTASITNSIIDDSRTQAGRRCAPGTLELTATIDDAWIPNGWLRCNGAAVSRSDYARLFAAIGTTYGAGNGTTTFNVPNLVDRIPVGWGATFTTIGAAGGAVEVTLTADDIPSHAHDMDHNHAAGETGPGAAHHHSYVTVDGSIEVAAAPGSGGNFVADINDLTSEDSSDEATHTHTFDVANFDGNTGNAGGGTAHENMPPYQVVTGWLIRT